MSQARGSHTDSPSELEGILRRITHAKDHVFYAQDGADLVGDRELRQRLAKARTWLEAADRRVRSLLMGAR